jgi:hypothetical protein
MRPKVQPSHARKQFKVKTALSAKGEAVSAEPAHLAKENGRTKPTHLSSVAGRAQPTHSATGRVQPAHLAKEKARAKPTHSATGRVQAAHLAKGTGRVQPAHSVKRASLGGRIFVFPVRKPLAQVVLAVCATGMVTTATVSTGVMSAVASGHWGGGFTFSGGHHHHWDNSGGYGTDSSSSNTTLPSSDTTLPTSDTTLPTSDTTLPTSDTTLPGTSGSQTSSDTTLPTSNTTLPITSGSQPSSSGTPASLIPNSIFNSNVTNWSVNSDSSAIVANIVAQYESAYGEVGVNFNRPVYEAASNTPDVQVSVASGCNDFTGDRTTPDGSGATGTEVPIPSYAQAGDSSDNILNVYQPSTNEAWEFWEASQNSNGSWSACWGGEMDMATSNGAFPYNYGETASGISNLATEISEADVASGSINHAIALEVLGDDCDWSNTSSNGGVYPATRTDCGQDIAGAPAEGQWFRFPANLAMPSGLTPFAQMVFKAVQTYGMVIVDQGGAVAIEADMADPGPWEWAGNSVASDALNNTTDNLPGYQLVASLPWQDLQAINPPQ